MYKVWCMMSDVGGVVCIRSFFVYLQCDTNYLFIFLYICIVKLCW